MHPIVWCAASVAVTMLTLTTVSNHALASAGEGSESGRGSGGMRAALRFLPRWLIAASSCALARDDAREVPAEEGPMDGGGRCGAEGWAAAAYVSGRGRDGPAYASFHSNVSSNVVFGY